MRHSFLPKKGSHIGPTKRGKGTKLALVASGDGVPLGIQFSAASPSEVNLLEATLDDVNVPDAPRIDSDYVVANRAYDADWLRDALEDRGMELVCPHRYSRKRPSRQDGRILRRH